MREQREGSPEAWDNPAEPSTNDEEAEDALNTSALQLSESAMCLKSAMRALQCRKATFRFQPPVRTIRRAMESGMRLVPLLNEFGTDRPKPAKTFGHPLVWSSEMR